MSRRPETGWEFWIRSYIEQLVKNTLTVPGFKQRNLRPTKVERFRRIHDEGRYDPYNSDTFAVGLHNGVEVLLNGFHRCAGFLASSRSGQMEVFAFKYREGERTALLTRDFGGTPKSIKDVLDITAGETVKHGAVLSSAAKLYVAFETGGGWRKKDLSVNAVLRDVVDADVVVEALADYPALHDICAWTVAGFRKVECPSHAKMAFCWAILRKHGGITAHEVDAFFEKVGTGLGINSEMEPCYLLRQKLLRLKGDMNGAGPAKFIYFVTRAFRAERRGERMARLQGPTDGQYVFVRP